MKKWLVILCVCLCAHANAQDALSSDKAPTVKPAPETNYAPSKTKKIGEVSIRKVKAAIEQSLKDPDSVKYRKIVIASNDGSLICGEFNAKNGMGGYAGYRRFMNFDGDTPGYTADDGSQSFKASWGENCPK